MALIISQPPFFKHAVETTAQSESARLGAVIKRSQDREGNLKHFVYMSWLTGEVRVAVVVLKERCKMLKRWQMLHSSTEMEHHLSRHLKNTGRTSSTKL